MFKVISRVAIGFPIFALAVVFVLYFSSFSGALSANHSHWGDFGSFVGGTLGAVFASLSFAALVYTILLQRTELNTAISSLEKSASAHKQQLENQTSQKFESTFYSLLNLHNQTLHELKVKEGGFDSYLHNLDTITSSVSPQEFLSRQQAQILSNVELSQYFRILYQLLKFIAKDNVRNEKKVFNEANILDRSTIVEYRDDEKMYASLVRSFVPVDLLPLLAINCMPTPNAINNLMNYWALLERYEFLEHIRLDRVPGNLSAFLILDRYSYALGENPLIFEKYQEILKQYPNLFVDVMEGGYLCVLHQSETVEESQ